MKIPDPLDPDQPTKASERLRYLLSGMYASTDSDDQLNAAINWFYFALVLGMTDPMAAAGILLELEDQPGWTEEYRQLTHDNVRRTLDRQGRYITAKEAIA